MTTFRSVVSTVASLALGGLVGAGVALLLAPHSGRATRAMLRNQGEMWMDEASDRAAQAGSRLKGRARRMAAGTRRRAAGLTDQMQDVLEQQRHALHEAVAAGPLSALATHTDRR